MNWHLQDAKNNLSKVVNKALTEGPQTVTVRGRRTALVISAEDYDRMAASGRHEPPKKSFAEFLLQPDPLWDDELVEEVNRRNRSLARDIDF